MELSDSFVDGFGDIVNILGGELKVWLSVEIKFPNFMFSSHPAHADPAGLEEVEVLLLLEEDAHLLAEPGVGEHPNLCGDVTPVPGGAQLLQLLPQARSHRDDS